MTYTSRKEPRRPSLSELERQYAQAQRRTDNTLQTSGAHSRAYREAEMAERSVARRLDAARADATRRKDLAALDPESIATRVRQP